MYFIIKFLFLPVYFRSPIYLALFCIFRFGNWLTTQPNWSPKYSKKHIELPDYLNFNNFVPNDLDGWYVLIIWINPLDNFDSILFCHCYHVIGSSDEWSPRNVIYRTIYIEALHLTPCILIDQTPNLNHAFRYSCIDLLWCA